MSQALTDCSSPARRRRSYHQISFRQLAKLPIGPIPDECLKPSVDAAQSRRVALRWIWGVSGLAVLAAMAPLASFADVIYTTYLAGKQELPTSVQLTDGTTASISGTEKFDTRPLAGAGSASPFTSNFGTGGVITGSFTGSFGVMAADQYGGAGNTGRYIATFSPTGLSVKFTHTAAVPGVNYFGLQLSAIDANNNLAIYREGVLLTSFSAATLQKALKVCPELNNPYCGNPTTGVNAGEQYAFLNVFDLSGYFDEIKFTQASGGGFEADNFTAGYRNPNTAFGSLVSVPSPASAPLLLAGVLSLMLLRLRGQAFEAWSRLIGPRRPGHRNRLLGRDGATPA